MASVPGAPYRHGRPVATPALVRLFVSVAFWAPGVSPRPGRSGGAPGSLAPGHSRRVIRRRVMAPKSSISNYSARFMERAPLARGDGDAAPIQILLIHDPDDIADLIALRTLRFKQNG